MIELILLVLIICALIAAIWGREAAQNAFGCAATTFVVGLVVCGIVVIVLIFAVIATSYPNNPVTEFFSHFATILRYTAIPFGLAVACIFGRWVYEEAQWSKWRRQNDTERSIKEWQRETNEDIEPSELSDDERRGNPICPSTHVVAIKLPKVTSKTRVGYVTWYKNSGDLVQKGEEIGRLHTNSNKPVTLVASLTGRFTQSVRGGISIPVGTIIAKIEGVGA